MNALPKKFKNINTHNIDFAFDCNIPCPSIFRAFNSCPTREISFSDIIYNRNIDDLLEVFMMIFSSIPYIISFLILINLMIHKTSRLFFIFILGVSQNVLIELTKNVLRDPIPRFHCNYQMGNPSNHATYLFTLIAWNLNECWYLENKFRIKNKTALLCLYLITPLNFISRYYLKYNTADQIFTGCIIGTLMGTVWFGICFRILISDRNPFNKIYAKLSIRNNMSDTEFDSYDDNAKILRKYFKLNEKSKEINRMKDNLESFTKEVENIEFIKNCKEENKNKRNNTKSTNDLITNMNASKGMEAVINTKKNINTNSTIPSKNISTSDNIPNSNMHTISNNDDISEDDDTKLNKDVGFFDNVYSQINSSYSNLLLNKDDNNTASINSSTYNCNSNNVRSIENRKAKLNTSIKKGYSYNNIDELKNDEEVIGGINQDAINDYIKKLREDKKTK